MPPASPVPGCSSGEVCRDNTATRRGSRRSLTTDPSRTDTSTPDSVGCDRPRELEQGHVELLTTFRERQMSYRSEPTQDRARNLPGRVLGTARGHHLVVVAMHDEGGHVDRSQHVRIVDIPLEQGFSHP